MRRPLPPFSAASAIEKVCFAEDAWNNRDAAGGEYHDAERDIRGFALKLAEQGNWNVVGKKTFDERSTVVMTN